MSIDTLPAHATKQSIAQDIATLLHAKTGVSVPVPVILQHFAAEGTGMSSLGGNGVGQYNLAGIQQNGKTATYTTPTAFVDQYVATAAADITGAIEKHGVARGQTLTAGQYAAALQYGGNASYCQGGCGTFYTSPAVTNAALDYHPGTYIGSASHSGDTVTGGTGSRPGGTGAPKISDEPTHPPASPSKPSSGGGLFGSLESWLADVGGRVGLVVLFAVLAVIVFVMLVRGDVLSAITPKP